MWLIFLLALFIETEAESTHYVECGLLRKSFKRNGDNRIVGGWEAKPHSIPWQVRLTRFYGDVPDGYCGGSLIRLQPGNQTRFVLTAAHCVVLKYGRYKDRVGSGIEVLLGAHNVNFYEQKQKVVLVQKFTRGLYDQKTMEEDIALLYLGNPVTFAHRIMPVCLPKSDEPLPKDAPCYISGWGSTVSNGRPSDTLRVVDVKILENKDCNIGQEKRARSFCAGQTEDRKDACQGDSGGPLMCIVNGSFFLYGITSYGEGCWQPGRPGVYTEVAKYIGWINHMAKQVLPSSQTPFTRAGDRKSKRSF